MNENNPRLASEGNLDVFEVDAATSPINFSENLDDGSPSATHALLETRTTGDDSTAQCSHSKPCADFTTRDREPLFVIIDSSCLSDPSSREMVVNKDITLEDSTILWRNYVNKNTVIKLPTEVPTTSMDYVQHQMPRSESREELQMITINLQSENEITVDDGIEKESIVVAYLKNRDDKIDSSLMKSNKKPSLLGSVAKMETILEGEQFSSFPFRSHSELSPDDRLASGDENEEIEEE